MILNAELDGALKKLLINPMLLLRYMHVDVIVFEI